ncbi:MAG: hypothetical protein DI636_03855 [Pelagerythrobacter marensis]|nr:MAG: hypothetical protein DI636_03855 [Pelagerythrobacter marensis]
MAGEWDRWIGGEAEGSDLLTQGLIDRFCATLDLDHSGTVAPPGLHWCLAPGAVPTAALGPDGHPPKGDLLPPIPLPRRMWAASRLEFLAPLTAGTPITRVTRVVSASSKEGRSGPLGFVELAMETRADGVPAVREVQTLVYRAAGSAMTPLPGADTPDLSGWDAVRTLTPNEPMLLRFSALTFNWSPACCSIMRRRRLARLPAPASAQWPPPFAPSHCTSRQAMPTARLPSALSAATGARSWKGRR